MLVKVFPCYIRFKNILLPPTVENYKLFSVGEADTGDILTHRSECSRHEGLKPVPVHVWTCNRETDEEIWDQRRPLWPLSLCKHIVFVINSQQMNTSQAEGATARHVSSFCLFGDCYLWVIMKYNRQNNPIYLDSFPTRNEQVLFSWSSTCFFLAQGNIWCL